VEIKELIGKEVFYKGNKCPVIATAVATTGAFVLELKVVATDKHKDKIWVDINEVRVEVFYKPRPRLFGKLVDAFDGWGKGEWMDADGETVPFRKDSKTGYLILDKENRPKMTMKIFDIKLKDIGLY